jgi:TetR/AcrR family transcriptional repressor of nem operon
MPRPRGFIREDALTAAKDAFWENGYHGTGLSELEDRTGLNRSSLYLAFGNKRELFAEALDLYTEEVIDGLIGPLESTPGVPAIRGFFTGVKGVILDERDRGRRGCLMVNTIAELAPEDEGATVSAVALRDRLQRAFARALESDPPVGATDPASIARRARLLMAGTLGIWICARFDLRDAAALCDEAIAEVDSWGSPARPRRAR